MNFEVNRSSDDVIIVDSFSFVSLFLLHLLLRRKFLIFRNIYTDMKLPVTHSNSTTRRSSATGEERARRTKSANVFPRFLRISTMANRTYDSPAQ